MGGDPKPLIYTVPAAPNQWGYTLTYHPLLQQHSSGSHQQGGQSQQQPASAAQTGTQIQQPAQQEAARPSNTLPHPPPNCNRWGRTLQPLPESTPLTAAEATQPAGHTQQPEGYEPPPWAVPADYVPPWERDPHRPQTEPPTQSSSSGETFTQQQAEGAGGAAPPKATTDQPQQQTAAQPAAGQAQPQAGGAATHTTDGNNAPGGRTIPPTAELEEEEEQEGGRGGRAQRPYHEGHGDQRMRGKRFKAAVQTAFGQRGWTKGDDVTWKEVAHLVGLREEDDESEWERVLQEGAQRGQRRQPARGKTPRAHPATAASRGATPEHTNFSLLLNLHMLPRGAPLPTQPQSQQPDPQPSQQVKQHATASGGAGDPRRRRDGAAAATAAAEEEAEEDEGNMLHWDGLFNYMMISPGGADRPETFPPELPFHADAEMHLRGLPHGAWAGITLPWKSRRGPEYTSSTRGFCRIKVRRRPGGVEPSGYMATSTAFVLFPWGRIQGGRPNKWLLHITERSERPPQEDADATQLQPGSSYTLEMPPGARTWQLGRLQPRLALQYYYDWGNMMGTGAIYDRLPRASNNPPLAWEQMALQLIPPRDDRESRCQTLPLGEPTTQRGRVRHRAPHRSRARRQEQTTGDNVTQTKKRTMSRPSCNEARSWMTRLHPAGGKHRRASHDLNGNNGGHRSAWHQRRQW